jgi:Mrp family chromosome partitioning ATPase
VPYVAEVDLLAAGRPIARTSDLMASPRMAELLRQAVAEYDLIVIDAPPVLNSSDTVGLAAHPEVTVVFVAPSSSKRRVVKKALRTLDLVEANVAGLVMNRAGRLETYGRY